MFGQLMNGIAQDFVRYVMHVQVVQQQRRAPAPPCQNVQTHSSDDGTPTALRPRHREPLAESARSTPRRRRAWPPPPAARRVAPAADGARPGSRS